MTECCNNSTKIERHGAGWYTITGETSFVQVVYAKGLDVMEFTADNGVRRYDNGVNLKLGEDFYGYGNIVALFVEVSVPGHFKVRVETG